MAAWESKAASRMCQIFGLFAAVLFACTVASPDERGSGSDSQFSLTPPLHAWRAEAKLTKAAEDKLCPDLDDRNGRWEGSREPGGRYELTCAPGFVVKGAGNHQSASTMCDDTFHWDKALVCEDVDDCANLTHGCGAFGVCIDLVGGYDCNCEEGYMRTRSHDLEIVCGGIHDNVCGGHTCGAYGICIDLDRNVSEFDTGNATPQGIPAAQTRSKQLASYRCECADGFRDNGETCVRLDCGSLTDGLGTWSGGTAFGQEYTLKCPPGAFVWGGTLRQVTLSCSSKGLWPSRPMCISPALEALDAEFATFRFWTYVALALLCVLSAALAAGLTMGLTTLEPFDLEVVLRTRSEECSQEDSAKLQRDQGYAEKIKPIVKDKHFLLVTLLLFNTVANESLPIFLDQLVPSCVAILLSVTVVLFCGEVLPSAIFTGPNRVMLAAKCIPLVRCLQALLCVVAKPIAMILDRLLGVEEAEDCEVKYPRAQLRALVQLHGPQAEEGANKAENGVQHHSRPPPLTHCEAQMLNSVLSLRCKLLQDLASGWTPLDSCVLVDAEETACDLVDRGALEASPSGAVGVIALKRVHDQFQNGFSACSSTTPLKTESIAGCLPSRALLSAGRVKVKEILEPLVLVNLQQSALEAVRSVSTSASALALVVRGEHKANGAGSAVVGVTTQAQLLSTLLRGLGEQPRTGVRTISDNASEPDSIIGAPLLRKVTMTRSASSSGFRSRTVPFLRREDSGVRKVSAGDSVIGDR